MKRIGVKKYDFMGARLNVEKGSKYESIQKFKQRFGCELKKGVHWEAQFNPLKYYSFKSLKWCKDYVGRKR